MKKELGVHPYLFPMPVLMIATYGDDNVVDVMNMAWGGICAENMVSLNIDEDHKTSENIKKRGAFTLSIADIPISKPPISSASPAATRSRTSSSAAA